MDLKKQLIEQYKFSESDWQKSIACFEPEVIPAKTFFLKQGKISDKLGFINSGILRSFFYDDHANEITTHFFLSGTVVLAMESFNNQVPSAENIQALEDAELLVLKYEKVDQLYQTVPIWRQIAKDVDDLKYNDLMNRSIQFQTLTAGERYELFCQRFPEIIQKVALRHIASYLGIDIATLSRIRSKK